MLTMNLLETEELMRNLLGGFFREGFMMLFAGVTLTIWFTFVAVGVLYMVLAHRKFKAGKPVLQYDYSQKHFDQDFTFVCESCSSQVSTTDAQCPKCGTAYSANKEYKMKKLAMNKAFLQYLKDQQAGIEKEREQINKTIAVIESSRTLRHDAFNFELTKPPVYQPADHFDFTCDYCNNRIQGKSSDETGCPYCGAGYQENIELLVREEEKRLEKSHYDRYIELTEIKKKQNHKNIWRDAKIENKHSFIINLMQKHAQLCTVLFFLLTTALAFIVTLFLQHYLLPV